MAEKLVDRFNLFGETILIEDSHVDTKLSNRFSRRYFQTRAQYEASKIYVSLNGSDSNPGTRNSPVKTLNKAFDLSCQFSTAVTIVIITAGTYILSNIAYSCLDIHITPEVAGITIELTDTNTMYNCHLNIGSTTIPMWIRSTTANKYWHFDGGQLYANKVYFDCYLEVNSCGSLFKGCAFATLHVRVSHATITDAILISPARPDIGSFYFDNSMVSIKIDEQTGTRINMDNTVDAPMFLIRNSTVNLACICTPLNNNKHSSFIDGNYFTLLSKDTYYNTYKNACSSEGTFGGRYITNVSVLNGGSPGDEVYGHN